MSTCVVTTPPCWAWVGRGVLAGVPLREGVGGRAWPAGCRCASRAYFWVSLSSRTILYKTATRVRGVELGKAQQNTSLQDIITLLRNSKNLKKLRYTIRDSSAYDEKDRATDMLLTWALLLLAGGAGRGLSGRVGRRRGRPTALPIAVKVAHHQAMEGAQGGPPTCPPAPLEPWPPAPHPSLLRLALLRCAEARASAKGPS